MTNPSQVQLYEATKPVSKPCCIIPARAGSKRIKGKNKKLLLGRPLFDYALKAAIESDLFALIIVSSDDLDILAHTYGYFSTNVVQPHLRPKSLCGDSVPIRVVVRYCLQSYLTGEDICLLQPTNPLITAETIKSAYKFYKRKKPNYLVGMCQGKDIGFHLFKKSVFLTEYEMNFYGTNWLAYDMVGVDIDTIEDWNEAERLLSGR